MFFGERFASSRVLYTLLKSIRRVRILNGEAFDILTGGRFVVDVEDSEVRHFARILRSWNG
ncbi:hypothetical protein, partial [Alkalibacterium gilvum]|uniref:hypothetical protein n=1 Tax=Alkalibacterium gilvum TaxID=1130080 RepID=UPI003F8FDA71